MTPTPKQQRILLEPFDYLVQNPGKEIRSKLFEAFQLWMQVPESHIDIIKQVVEMLHTSSLLVDDVEDNSDLRRGVPVAHKIFGVASTINTANYVYFLALEKLLTLNDNRVVQVFTEEMLELHIGQGMEIHWRDTVTCPSEDEYMVMVQQKTGGLLRLGVKLMQLCSGATEDYVNLVNLIGTHYQIRDDYVNLKSTKYQEGKGFAEDLTEGKFSYPIVVCIGKGGDSGSHVEKVLRQRTNDRDVKMWAIGELERSGAFEVTKRMLRQTEERVRAEIRRFGGNAMLERMLDVLSEAYAED